MTKNLITRMSKKKLAPVRAKGNTLYAFSAGAAIGKTSESFHNRLTSGELLSNDRRVFGFVSSQPWFSEASFRLTEGA